MSEKSLAQVAYEAWREDDPCGSKFSLPWDQIAHRQAMWESIANAVCSHIARKFKFMPGDVVYIPNPRCLECRTVEAVICRKDSFVYDLGDRNIVEGALLTKDEAIDWIKRRSEGK